MKNFDFKSYIKQKISIMKETEGIIIEHLKFYPGISRNKVDKILSFSNKTIPRQLLNFYSSVNGLELTWSYASDKTRLSGFFNFWSLERLLFGYEGKMTKSNLLNPFEEILWNEDYEKKVINELRDHFVIESIEGEDAYITCKISNDNLSLFYVFEDRWKPILLDFDEYIFFIVETFGVSNIRYELTKPRFLEALYRYKDLKKMDELISADFSFLEKS